MSAFSCPLCLTNRDFVSLAQMFRHITIFHQNESNFKATCNLDKTCGVLYRTYSAYKSHIYRKHSLELYSSRGDGKKNTILDVDQQEENKPLSVKIDEPSGNNIDELSGNNIDELAFNDDNIDLILSNIDYGAKSYDSVASFGSVDIDEKSSEFKKNIKKSFILFVLQLREEFLLPKNVTSIISDYIITLMENIEIILEEKAVDSYIDSPSSLSKSFPRENKKTIEYDQVKNTLSDIRDGIKSITKNEYQFIKQCEQYFGYRSPEEIIISSPNEFPECGYFLPVDKTLLSLLSHRQFVTQILENIEYQHVVTEHDDDLMFSVRDAFSGNRLDHDSLLIQLYLDDIALTNPIGSKKDMHKMCMVYFTLEDIPDQYRSKIDFIQLVGICESKFIKDAIKAKRFFQPIVDNLNNLQLHGLLINGTHHKFSFSTLVADNLAAHMIGGFQACFNNGNFCRRCDINYEERKLPLRLSRSKVRTVSDHDSVVQEIKRNSKKSSLNGVIGESPLHDLIGFHPILSLPGDVMHDFIEGVCPMIVMSLLKQASSMRLITYARIQKRMENFKYGYFDTSDQPPPIQVKHLNNGHIVATAAQKLCMFKLFPIIFHDLIHHLPSFIVYKVLREILDLVLSYPFRKQWLPVLGDLCNTFHQMMLLHFPTKMIPKVHFVCEYERIIHDFGPAIKYWCFRYEAGHSYFKKIAMRTNNFKNTPKMLATHYRLKQCFTFCHLSRLKIVDYPIGIKRVPSECFNASMKSVLVNHFGRLNTEEYFIQCTKLIHENIQYCQSCVYVMNVEPTYEQPIFAQIAFILKMQEKWWLLMNILQIVSYNEDLSAWEIKSFDHYAILDPYELKYFHKGLDVYEVNNSSFVSFTARLTSYH